MKCGIYVRVSTAEQTVENQLRQLRQFAVTQGWGVVAEFSDEAVSGAKSEKERLQFKAMFEAASRRRFDVLLFWSLDRLSREGVLPTLNYLQRLDSYGVAWRSFTEQYLDSTGVFRDAVLAILACIAKQERVRRSERTRAGLARVRASGKPLGPPRKLNGQHIAQIGKLHVQGLSGRAIAKQLGISEASVRRLAAAS